MSPLVTVEKPVCRDMALPLPLSLSLTLAVHVRAASASLSVSVKRIEALPARTICFFQACTNNTSVNPDDSTKKWPLGQLALHTVVSNFGC